MNRYIGYGSLLLLVGWLVLSYTAWVPAQLRFTAPSVQTAAWFQQISVALFLLFVAIQLWLLGSTVWVVQRHRQSKQPPTPGSFTLSIVGELFWTALPLFLTVGLALAGYQLWASL